MTTASDHQVRRAEAPAAADVPADRLRPGDVVDTIGTYVVKGPIDRGTWVSYVVRYRNGVLGLREFDLTDRVRVHGRNLTNRDFHLEEGSAA